MITDSSGILRLYGKSSSQRNWLLLHGIIRGMLNFRCCRISFMGNAYSWQLSQPWWYIFIIVKCQAGSKRREQRTKNRGNEFKVNEKLSKCPSLIFLHKNSTVGEEKVCNQQSCNSEETFDILEKPKVLNLTVSIANASNSKISSYSEKLLPFNKRKSQYYVWQEGESVIPTTEDNSCPGNEMDWTETNVKIRSLRSIYRRTRPITDGK